MIGCFGKMRRNKIVELTEKLDVAALRPDELVDNLRPNRPSDDALSCLASFLTFL